MGYGPYVAGVEVCQDGVRNCDMTDAQGWFAVLEALVREPRRVWPQLTEPLEALMAISDRKSVV